MSMKYFVATHNSVFGDEYSVLSAPFDSFEAAEEAAPLFKEYYVYVIGVQIVEGRDRAELIKAMVEEL